MCPFHHSASQFVVGDSAMAAQSASCCFLFHGKKNGPLNYVSFFARMLQIFTDYLFRWAMNNGPLSFLGHDSWAIFYMEVITQTQELPRTKLCIIFIHVLSNWKVSPPCLSYLIIAYRCIYMYLNNSSHFLSHAARCKVQMSHGWTIPSRLEKPCLPSFFPRNISCLGSSSCWTETTLNTT